MIHAWELSFGRTGMGRLDAAGALRETRCSDAGSSCAPRLAAKDAPRLTPLHTSSPTRNRFRFMPGGSRARDMNVGAGAVVRARVCEVGAGEAYARRRCESVKTGAAVSGMVWSGWNVLAEKMCSAGACVVDCMLN